MSTTLEYGKKILLKRMIKSLEGEGYKVEYAPDYEGFIIADKRDDPNIFLLAANTIDELRNENAGKPAAFLSAVIGYVKANISIGTASVPPSAEAMIEPEVQEEVPPTPPALETVPTEEGDEPVFTGEALPAEQALDQAAQEILDTPTDQDEYGESDDVEEISNIIPEDELK